MKNKNWYFLCDLDNNIALEYTPLPEVWGNIAGLDGASDETLSDLSHAGYPDRGFLKEAAAIELGIEFDSINAAKTLCAPIKLEEVRDKRDILLTQSDKAVTIDRWETYDTDTKGRIAAYRQGLRDITEQPDIFNPVWPTIPTELGYLIDFV